MLTKEIKSLFKHSSIYGIGTIAGQAIGFILLPLYTRYLTPSDYGIATIIEITMALVGITVGAGILNSMARFYHEYDEEISKKCVVSTMYWIVAGISIISFLAILFSSIFLSNYLFSDTRYASLFNINAGSLALGFLVDTALLYLMIKNQSLLYVTISIATLIAHIVFNIWFIVFMELGLKGVFYSTLITRVILTVIVSLPILLKVGIGFSWQLAINMFKFSFPMIFSSLFRLMANESDKYFINYFFSPFETGIYAIANKIGTAVHILVTTPFLRSYNPKRFEIMKQVNANQSYASILNYYLLIIVTAGFILSVFSNEIIRLMTTENYFKAANYIPLIVTAWIIFGTRYHFETGILITNKTKYFAYINGFTAIFSVSLNYFLIGYYKIWGALLALNISQFLTTLLFYKISHNLYPIKYDFVFITKLAGLGFSFYAVANLIEHEIIFVSFALKSIVVAFYFISLRIFGLLDDALLNQIKKITKKTIGLFTTVRTQSS